MEHVCTYTTLFTTYIIPHERKSQNEAIYQCFNDPHGSYNLINVVYFKVV